jgi:hypothetical protein
MTATVALAAMIRVTTVIFLVLPGAAHVTIASRAFSLRCCISNLLILLILTLLGYFGFFRLVGI